MISWDKKTNPSDHIKSNIKNHDLVLVHDKPIDVSDIRETTAYFVPGVFPHKEGEELLETFNHVISPVKYIGNITWNFNIPFPKEIKPFKERENKSIYV